MGKNTYGYKNLKLHNSQVTEYGLMQLTDLGYQTQQKHVLTGCIW